MWRGEPTRAPPVPIQNPARRELRTNRAPGPGRFKRCVDMVTPDQGSMEGYIINHQAI